MVMRLSEPAMRNGKMQLEQPVKLRLVDASIAYCGVDMSG